MNRKYFFASFSKNYVIFALIVILITTSLAGIATYTNFRNYHKNNNQTLSKQALQINDIINESFAYINHINIYIGKQIAENDTNNLNVILNIFRKSSGLTKDNNKNAELFSWSSFDWVNPNGYQIVNNMMGIHKNPFDMKERKYVKITPKNPWTLQVSFPVFGNPSETWVIPVATGIVDKNNKYLGSVVVGINIAEFADKIEQKLVGKSSFIVLDQNLNIILQSSDNNLDPKNNFQDQISDFNFLKNDSGILDKKINVNNISYSHYQKITNYPYIVLTGFNQNFLNKEFNNSVLPIILQFTCLLIFFLIMLFLFETRMIFFLETEKKLKEEADKAQLAKSSLLKTLSHDLRNYVYGMNGMLEIILESKVKNDLSKEEEINYLNALSKSSKEMSHFLEDLLDAQQAESGILKLNKIEDCDLKEIIERVTLFNQSQSTNNKITIKTSFDENLPKIKFDQKRLKQILMNLVDNALKYSNSNTTVEIICRYLKDNNEVAIYIKDQGIGMTAEEIKMALAGNGTAIEKTGLNKNFNSNGIGLLTVKQLMEAGQGRINITSKKNEGSIFELVFRVI